MQKNFDGDVLQSDIKSLCENIYVARQSEVSKVILGCQRGSLEAKLKLICRSILSLLLQILWLTLDFCIP